MSNIREAAIGSYPNEACGFVISIGKGKSTFYEAKNTSPSPQNFFLIDTDEYLEATKIGEIVAVWHTHVNTGPSPSEADKAGCENSDLPWYILSIFKRERGFEFSELIGIEPSGYEVSYVGRPYAYGALDCWSLVRDFYRREFGIKLGDYPRVNEFWKNGQDFFGENWKSEGMVVVDGELQRGDILFFQTDGGEFPNHTGVYLGNERVLHHSMGRLSREEIYTFGCYWHKHTVKKLRHKSKCL